MGDNIMRQVFLPAFLFVMVMKFSFGQGEMSSVNNDGILLKVNVRNIAGGNQMVPGSDAMVYLGNDSFGTKQPTRDGVAEFPGVPPGEGYHVWVEVKSSSRAYGNTVEHWGSSEIPAIAGESQIVDFERSMPYVAGISAFEADMFSHLSALKAGTPVKIRLLVKNPASNVVNLKALLMLKNGADSSTVLLEQIAIIKAGGDMQLEFSFIPEVPGEYFFAPALELQEQEVFTDCWDWSDLPLFSVIRDIRTISFGGFRWNVKTGMAPPGPNHWSDHPDHIWVDEDGVLTLTLTPSSNRWLSTEIASQGYFGYGTYTFFINSDPTLFDPHMVAALFLFHDGENEIDIEFTRWGDPENETPGNYVLQPATNPGNQFVFPLDLQGNHSTHRIIWQPGRVVFESWHGHYPEPVQSTLIARWENTGKDVPSDYRMRLHFNFWLFRGHKPNHIQGQSFVISGFDYKPLFVGNAEK